MSLVETVRKQLGPLRSFQLMGEELALVSGRALVDAADAYRVQLERSVPAPLRARFELEQAGILADAHSMLRRYNRSLHLRVRGYVQLGRRCNFVYPWPVVAIIGICQVLGGMDRSRLFALLGPFLRRAGYRLFEQIADGADDALRRTNRGIFADSVPTVLYGLRCYYLRTHGDCALADALQFGPLPPIFDEESRALIGALVEGLGISNEEKRFSGLAALTLLHFRREQSIFSYHLGEASRESEPALLRRAAALREVPAPVIEQARDGRRLTFKPYALPSGFDLRNHDARVEHFGRAFVTSITAHREDYDAATRYVLWRFG